MAERVRWGIVGTGNIARQFAAGVTSSQRGVLTSVGSRSAGSAETFAQMHGIAHFGEYAQTIYHEDVDAIYISLPNAMHHEWTIKALQAGKHVLCEKPIACSGNEAREMFAVAHQQQRTLIEAYMYRAHPQTLAVQQAIASGAIGTVRHIRTNFCFKVAKAEGNIRFDPRLCGGALMDVGGYCLSFAMLFAGAELVEAHAVGRLHERGVDEQTSAVLRFANGVTSHFAVGMSMQGDNTAMICGEDGYIEIAWPWKPASGRSGYTICRQTPPRQDHVGKSVPTAPPREVVDVPVAGDLYGLEADAFAATVLDGAPSFMPEAQSIALATWMQRIRGQIGLSY